MVTSTADTSEAPSKSITQIFLSRGVEIRVGYSYAAIVAFDHHEAMVLEGHNFRNAPPLAGAGKLVGILANDIAGVKVILENTCV